jgi:hypothetical protein
VGGSARSGPRWVPSRSKLHDHPVVGVVEVHDLVALVGKRRAALGEVVTHLALAVEHVPGGHQLVTRMAEGRDRAVEVVVVLRRHVLAHDGLSSLS